MPSRIPLVKKEKRQNQRRANGALGGREGGREGIKASSRFIGHSRVNASSRCSTNLRNYVVVRVNEISDVVRVFDERYSNRFGNSFRNERKDIQQQQKKKGEGLPTDDLSRFQ